MVSELERIQQGPFASAKSSIVHCHHTGFKNPQQKPQLEDGELTGSFNWIPFAAETELEDPYARDLFSCLPAPTSNDTEAFWNDTSSQQMKNALRSLQKPIVLWDWFTDGSQAIITSIAASLESSSARMFNDFWRECSIDSFTNFVSNFWNNPSKFYFSPVLHWPESGGLILGDSISILTSNGENIAPNTSYFPLNLEFSKLIIQNITNLARLSAQGDLSFASPLRFFVCSNIQVEPFCTIHGIAFCILSLSRYILITHKCVVEVEDLEIEGQLDQLGRIGEEDE